MKTGLCCCPRPAPGSPRRRGSPAQGSRKSNQITLPSVHMAYISGSGCRKQPLCFCQNPSYLKNGCGQTSPSTRCLHCPWTVAQIPRSKGCFQTCAVQAYECMPGTPCVREHWARVTRRTQSEEPECACGAQTWSSVRNTFLCVNPPEPGVFPVGRCGAGDCACGMGVRGSTLAGSVCRKAWFACVQVCSGGKL